MVYIKVFDEASMSGPDVDFVITVAEMVCEAAAKVARAEYEDFGFRRRRRGHGCSDGVCRQGLKTNIAERRTEEKRNGGRNEETRCQREYLAYSSAPEDAKHVPRL